MIKKHDELIAQTKQKEEFLKNLYLELDTVTHMNLVDDVAVIEVSEKVEAKHKELHNINKVYQQKHDDALYDTNCASSILNFTKLDSIMEHK